MSPPPKPTTYTGRDYFTTEDFVYDEEHDVFICPEGQTLRFVGVPKDRPDRRKYRAPRTACRVCALKARCTRAPQRELKVSRNHAALVRLRADAKTESFRKLYRARAPVIEGVFAEEKQWHGLRRAWRRGLSNMLIQSLLVATVMNCKRLMAVIGPMAGLISRLQALLRTLRRMWRTTGITLRWSRSKMHGAQIAV